MTRANCSIFSVLQLGNSCLRVKCMFAGQRGEGGGGVREAKLAASGLSNWLAVHKVRRGLTVEGLVDDGGQQGLF